ncbi:MAG: hemolysin family protein [Rhodospirillaceae bacterium]
MTDLSGNRPARDDESDEQASLSRQFSGWLRGILRHRGDNTLRDAIEELIDEQGGDEGSLGASERLLLANILKLRDRTVIDAMVPRADIVAFEISTSFTDLVSRIAADGHSRIPVYRETLDDVIGIVHIKDVIACIAQGKQVELIEIVRDVQIAAPSMPVLDLLLQMRQTRQHMAMVVDEFGGIDGLVTIEDLVEEIVGEIEDEHDDESEPEMIEKLDGTLIADARVSIELFEARVGQLLSDDERQDIDTLGGLIVSMAGRVPGRGELLSHPLGLEFEVLDADPRRVKRIRVRNPPTRTEEQSYE